MIDYKNVKEYIEFKNNIKLAPIQVQILKAIIRGDEVYTARGAGRSMLYNGYSDYIKNVIAKDTNRNLNPDEFDSIFTFSMMCNDDYFKGQKIENCHKTLRETCPKRFLAEFECKFDK